MKFGVIVFPGSNCDHDAYHVISKHVGQPVDFIWHRETDLSTYDAVIIPGGFSYGDYLRAGALASFSPVMASVRIWKPLQIPSTGPPSPAKRSTARMTGAKRAIAPQRR